MRAVGQIEIWTKLQTFIDEANTAAKKANSKSTSKGVKGVGLRSLFNEVWPMRASPT